MTVFVIVYLTIVGSSITTQPILEFPTRKACLVNLDRLSDLNDGASATTYAMLKACVPAVKK